MQSAAGDYEHTFQNIKKIIAKNKLPYRCLTKPIVWSIIFAKLVTLTSSLLVLIYLELSNSKRSDTLFRYFSKGSTLLHTTATSENTNWIDNYTHHQRSKRPSKIQLAATLRNIRHLLAEGYTNKEIMEMVHLEERTFYRYMKGFMHYYYMYASTST